MAQDLVDFLKADFSQKKEYVIDQLISSDGYGIFAGRTGLGKTNLLLNISVWLSTGFMFFFHPVKRIKVGFFAFEGTPTGRQSSLVYLPQHYIKVASSQSYRNRLGRETIVPSANLVTYLR